MKHLTRPDMFDTTQRFLRSTTGLRFHACVQHGALAGALVAAVLAIAAPSNAQSGKRRTKEADLPGLPAVDPASVDPVIVPPTQLAVFTDADFERRFAESYAAETDIEPKLADPEKKQMLEVLKLMQEEKMGEAAAAIEKLRSPSSSAVFDFTLANIYFQDEKLEQAVAEYTTAVQKFPKFRRAWRNLALIHVRNGDMVKALPALTKVVELGGGDSMTYGLMGFAYSANDNAIAAESAYRMAILLDPATRDWKLGLAKSFFKQKRFADAVALTGDLIAETPDAADLWLLQANAYVGLGQAMKAAQNYEVVDRLGKTTVDSLNMLGDIYINEALYDNAVSCYERALAKTPRGAAERPIRAAKVMVGRGASIEAERLLGTVEKTFGGELADAERKDILKMKARMAVAKGAGDEEARILEEIVGIDPLDGEALILLGQYHGRKGEIEKAIFLYERAAKIEKTEADAKVRHAQLLVGQQRYSEALPLLRSAQQIKPRENIQQYLEQVERASKQRGS
jgi:tetratricopeptide (TPR) repeat protein